MGELHQTGHHCGEFANSANPAVSSMLFGSVQNMEQWKSYFNNPTSSTLGLLGALYQIGSLGSIPIV
jgi:hypothetical protein